MKKLLSLQNALRYNFVLLSPASFPEIEGENSLSVDTSKIISPTCCFFCRGAAPWPLPLATTPLELECIHSSAELFSTVKWQPIEPKRQNIYKQRKSL